MNADLNKLSAARMASQIRSGEITAEDVMADCLTRITERESEIGAFTSFDAERALSAARAVDKTGGEGALLGVPFVIKDIIDTRDFPTGWGSSIYQGQMPIRNASCVELFLRAGAVPIGKTVTTEFAYFQPGKTANPHNTAHTPGGSSSGSAAAVADFMAPLAFGSQTAASLIRPAAYCGVLGYKPSHGAFDLQGVMGMSPSLDTLGLLACSVEGLRLARSVLCGSDPVSSRQFDDPPPRVVLLRGPHWQEGTVEMRDVCQRALQCLAEGGAETGEITHPPVFDELTESQKTVMAYETARARIYEYSRFKDQISDQFITLIEDGLATPYAKYNEALQVRSIAARKLEMLFMDVDVILVPAAPGEAPKGLGATGDPLYSRAWNLLQVPCISIPFGKGPMGMPLSVQLIGQFGKDDQLLDVADWISKCLGKVK